jgi:cytoskeletal protein CcmA (bactofilin family)
MRDAAMPASGRSAEPAPSPPKLLIVGAGISLAGEITACDRLVVQGTARVTLHGTRAIEIAETGRFIGGRAEVEEAVIAGRYEGELTVRGRLLIRATGQIAGTVRYGELEVERGGQLAGTVAEREGEAQADAAGGQGSSGNVAPLALPRSASSAAERRQDAGAVKGSGEGG